MTYDPTQDLQEYDPEDDGYEKVYCSVCGGTGIAVEGWDCEECDGEGYWTV